MSEMPRTRREAKRLGAPKYFTGKPCSKGHMVPRYVGGMCTSCSNAYRKKEYAARTDGAADRPRPERCECCGGLPGTRALHWDHCHVTGKFRGWLCHMCNVGIGCLQDNIEGLRWALAYLERAK